MTQCHCFWLRILSSLYKFIQLDESCQYSVQSSRTFRNSNERCWQSSNSEKSHSQYFLFYTVYHESFLIIFSVNEAASKIFWFSLLWEERLREWRVTGVGSKKVMFGVTCSQHLHQTMINKMMFTNKILMLIT